MRVAFAVQKLLTFFSAKNIRILYIESAKTVNGMTLNALVKLTTLWTTGPCWFCIGSQPNSLICFCKQWNARSSKNAFCFRFSDRSYPPFRPQDSELLFFFVPLIKPIVSFKFGCCCAFGTIFISTISPIISQQFSVIVRDERYEIAQLIHNVETTSIQRWFSILTLNQRWIDVVSVVCACWNTCAL